MANTSVSGLVSGLDTATIISQLMQIEAQPQTMLKSRLSTQQSAISSLQSINSKFAGLATKAHDLAQTLDWSPVKATSSLDTVTVSADPGATATSLSFTVNQVATSYSIDYGIHALTDAVTTDGSTKVYLDKLDGSGLVEFDTGDGTVQGLANAINSSDKGLRATLVQVSSGQYRLKVTATDTGVSSDFTLQDGSGNALALTGTATAGQQAQITVGADVITQDSNTFTDLMPGVDVTLGAGASGAVTIGVTQDGDAAKTAVKGLVDAANEILDAIDKQSAYDSTTKKSGPLSGDSTLRDLRSQVLDAVTSAADGRSLAGIGVQLDRYGKITFDEAKFDQAYAADPANVASLLGSTSTWSGTGTPSMESASWRTAAGAHSVDSTAGTIDGVAGTLSGSLLSGASSTGAEGLVVDVAGGASGTLTYVPGFAARLEAVAQRASDAYDGALTNDIKGRQSSVGDMQDSIDDWDTRLQIKREALNRRFAALEVALGKMQDQASWLSGQISSLPTMGS